MDATTQDTGHSSSFIRLKNRQRIIGAVLIILVAAAIGYVIYKRSTPSQEEREQQLVDQVAESASKVNKTDEEKAKIIADLKAQPAVKLSPEEAAKREAEIMNAIINTSNEN